MARLDQLAAERAEQRPRDRREPERPARRAGGWSSPEERVIGKAAEELRVVVVDREDEAKLLERAVAARTNDDRAVGTLPRVDELAVELRT